MVVWKGESGKVYELNMMLGGFNILKLAVFCLESFFNLRSCANEHISSDFLPGALLGPIECPAVWPWILRPVSSRQWFLFHEAFCHLCFSEIDSRLVKSKLRLTSNISAPCKPRGCNGKSPETSGSHSRNATAPHLWKAGKMQSSEASHRYSDMHRWCLFCWAMQ